MTALTRSRETPKQTWRAVGVRQGRGSEWFYIFDVEGRSTEIRGVHMASIGSLLAICHDADYWRALFPKPHSRSNIDVVASAGMLVRECWAAQVRQDEAAQSALTKAEAATMSPNATPGE